MQYTKATFTNNSTVPPVNASALNKWESTLEYLAKVCSEKATLVEGSTDSNYILNIGGYSSAPTSGDLPILIVFTPSVTNAAGATITTNWGSTYQIYDTSTNAQVQAAEIKANQPIAGFLDGTKFWVSTSGAFLKIGLIAGMEGYFYRGTSVPVGSTPLVWNGDFYASKVNGAVYNDIGADVAEGYPVIGEYERGDLICINEDGTFSVNSKECNHRVLGVVSSEDQYAALYGTKYGKTPIAKLGRILAKVSGKCTAGDYLAASPVKGCIYCVGANSVPRGTIVAQALESKQSEEVGLVLVDTVRL